MAEFIMKKDSRVGKIYANSIFSLIYQIIKILLAFGVRKIFILELGANYLGYNAVFVNILDLLNVADLGIGVAITSFLYLPLAKNDMKTVHTLMHLYKKIYMYIGIIVFFLGIIVSFFLSFLIPDANEYYIYAYYYVNLLGTVSTYYLAYKRTLLIADQKAYINSIIDSLSFIFMSILQILVLCIFHSFLVYLVIKVMCSLISNYNISFYYNRHYRFLYAHNQEQENFYKLQIFRYVKDVFIARIGAYIFLCTDNVIISIIKGSLLAGFLSNYTMITSQINAIITQVFSSVQGSLGNYINTNNINKQKEMTNNYLLVTYLISNICLSGVLFVIQPFVEIYLGNEYLLNQPTIILLSVNLFLMILLQLPSQLFVIYKLFHYDRFIVIISGLVNIIVSIVLVNKMGINGVLIGTFVASVIYLFSRFYFIETKIFSSKKFYYIFKILIYTFISFLGVIIVGSAARAVSGYGIKLCVVRLLLSVSGAVSVPLLILSKTKEFQFLFERFVPRKFKKYINIRNAKWVSLFCIVALIAISIRGLNLNNYDINDGNKSIERNIHYVNEEHEPQYDKYVHVSFDDTIYLFEDLTTKQDVYQSIFDNSFLQWIKSIHDKYGTKFSCYVYYKDVSKGFTLSECTRKFEKEFIANSDWLKFGFHAYDSDTSYNEKCLGKLVDDYELVYSNLVEIVGNVGVDHFTRLHGFQSDYDNIMQLLEKHPNYLIGLLTADDQRGSYYLNAAESEYIYSHDFMVKDELIFVSSDLRIELISDIEEKIIELETDAWNNQRNDLILFTHEWAVDDSVKMKLDKLLKYTYNQNYENAFPELVHKTIRQ